MAKERKILIFFLIILITTVAVNFFANRSGLSGEEIKRQARVEEKSKKFSLAPEVKTIQKSLTKNKVVLVYFFTGSCSNCEATAPHVNAWYDTYRDKGLQTIGILSPEFAFEKEAPSTDAVVERLGIKYPVINDNNYDAWKAYKNNFWPRIYIIDRDGFMIYDHIGEGAYSQTEGEIKEALNEGAMVADTKPLIDTDSSIPPIPQTGDTYLGYARNNQLGIGETHIRGIQKLSLPKIINPNKFYLGGTWNLSREFAENKYAGAKIILKYNAKEVYLVAGSLEANTLMLSQDDQKTVIEIYKTGLYKILTNKEAGEHTLEITITNPSLQTYVFRFR
ncbi:MAG: redoxin domain-containing protein [Candidatus Vogelbacteria bacterium]|nr:redoxin domain-containing protein [Candidatus Vogelbacteria bacterium]